MQELVTGGRDRIHLAFVPVRCVNTVFVRHAGSLGTRGVRVLLTSPAPGARRLAQVISLHLISIPLHLISTLDYAVYSLHIPKLFRCTC